MTAPKPLAITPGEPAGIGPDLAIMLAQQQWPVPLVFIADPSLLTQRAEVLGLPFKVLVYPDEMGTELHPGEAFVLPVQLNESAQAGSLNAENASYVLRTLDAAIDGCLDGSFSALVTGPVHKGVINEAGMPFSGHTEYLQQRCGVEKVVMMLANRKMKVALASTHLPLKDVASAVTQDSLAKVVDILIHDMHSKFAISTPRILVAGLNPHAGEGGHMGREEIDVIEPVMQTFAQSGASLIGPLPADTLFTPKYLDNADAVLAMYHDQGLPVLKYAGFGESVNITLGLPIIRTSVDHGTALDLAGSGNIDVGSFKAAVSMAVQMVEAQT